MVDLEVFEDVDAEFFGAGEIDVTVVVEVRGDELRARAGRAVDGEGDALKDGIAYAIADGHRGALWLCR